MKATVTTKFKGCEDGQTQPRTIAVGEVITGDLARVAIEAGWAEGAEASAKAKKPPRNKMLAGAERNKSGSASQAAPASRQKTAKPFDEAD